MDLFIRHVYSTGTECVMFNEQTVLQRIIWMNKFCRLVKQT